MTRTRTAGLALLLAALLVAGCGGGGDGEPTVTQTLHDELQAELDAALAELAEERDAKTTAEGEATRLEGELGTAQASVVRLQTRIATAEASVADLTGQLATATTSVTDLTADLAMAEAEAAQLTADLDAAEAQVANLTAVIGLATDVSDASATASLHAQLNAANAESARLETLIGSAADSGNAAGSLHAQLNAANAEVTRLTTALSTAQNDLTTSQARVTELQTLVGDATNPTATSLRGQIAKLTVDLAAEKAKVTALTSQLSTAQTERDTAQQQVQQAQQQAQQAAQQAQQQASNLEANQRADKLQEALEMLTPTPSPVSPVTVSVPTRGSLRLERGGHASASLSGSGIRSTTMALNVGADSGKTVVYTDRELSRPLLEHFDQQRNVVNGTVSNRFDLEGPLAVTDGVITYVARPLVTTDWRVTHGVPTSLAGVHIDNDDDPATPSSNDDGDATTTDPLVRPADPANPAPRTSYAGHLYGLSGNFVCGGTNCQIQLMPTYVGSANDAGTSFALQSVTLTNTVSGSPLFFQPSSSAATLSLYQGGPVGPDQQYMVFGYWREDPTSAAADYNVGVFAQAFNGGSPQTVSSPTATYDGTAVGLYVEQDPTNPVDTHRQGEFVADIDLRAAAGNVSGTIDDFVTTPTGGSAPPRTADRWVVNLTSTAEGTAADTDITTLAGDTTGMWEFDFVQAHQYAAMADGTADPTPPGVTGTFEAQIVDFLHLVGAFGADRR